MIHGDPEADSSPATRSELARRAIERDPGEIWFRAEWSGMTFLHYEVDPAALQRVVPYPLDLREGRAHVSLVAFTMRRFRPARGGRLAAWLTRPLATQGFLNLRTYVTGNLGPGIFFMREWIDHPLAVPLGPLSFGLPYHRGALSNVCSKSERSLRVEAGGRIGEYRGAVQGEARAAAEAVPGSLEEFLAERYTAYTDAGIRPLAFRVWHPPWLLAPLRDEVSTMPDFLAALGEDWTATLRPVGAAASAGVEDVAMGRPRAA